MKSISYKKLLNKIIKKSKLLDREKFLGDKLAQMLVYDVLFGMGVRGKFKSAMKRNYAQLEVALSHYMKKYDCTTKEQLLHTFDSQNSMNGQSALAKPKYIFLSRLKQRHKKVILKMLEESGFELVKLEDECDEDAFKAVISGLNERQFVKDFHVKNLYIFKANSVLSKENNNELFNEGHLLQIDKVKISGS
jgi:putative methyltransferase